MIGTGVAMAARPGRPVTGLAVGQVRRGAAVVWLVVGVGLPTVHRGDFCIDVTRPRVSVAGEPVLLTRKEYELLALICAANGAVCRRSLLIAEVWGPHLSDMDNTLNVHVANLRSKLARRGLIETVRGSGYRLGERPEPAVASNPSAALVSSR